MEYIFQHTVTEDTPRLRHLLHQFVAQFSHKELHFEPHKEGVTIKTTINEDGESRLQQYCKKYKLPAPKLDVVGDL